MPAFRIFKRLQDLLDVNPAGLADGDVPTWSAAGQEFTMEAGGGGGGGAPVGADYLVGTADAGLTNEIVVGPTPGGELGGTWAIPTVDAVHSGSSHAATQAAAEATAAAALAAHVGVDVVDGDAAGGVLSGTYPNPGFAVDMATQAELDAHVTDAADAHDASAISNVAAGGIVATDVQAAINELDTEKVSTTTFDDHSARHENGGLDEISVAGLSGELADAQPITVRKNTGADVGTRSRLNFIEGTNVTLTVADDGVSDEVDITITSSGGGLSPDNESLIVHMEVFA